MKQFLSLLLLVLISFQCKDQDTNASLNCTGNCLFALENRSGTMTKMDCFNRFGIKTRHPETDSTIYGIPDKLDPAFEVEGKSVQFSGVFRENTLTPAFPDPSFSASSLFQMEIVGIK